MSDACELPTTTGRRTWRLIRTLALPWVVCGGLLWALVGLTPEPQAGGPTPKDFSPGLAAGLLLQTGDPDWAVKVVVAWDGRDGAEVRETSGAVKNWALFFVYGEGSSGDWFIGWLNVLCLLPFPLLWSGFNVWRWVRRGRD